MVLVEASGGPRECPRDDDSGRISARRTRLDAFFSNEHAFPSRNESHPSRAELARSEIDRDLCENRKTRKPRRRAPRRARFAGLLITTSTLDFSHEKSKTSANPQAQGSKKPTRKRRSVAERQSTV
jgi:hypothetical protein